MNILIPLEAILIIAYMAVMVFVLWDFRHVNGTYFDYKNHSRGWAYYTSPWKMILEFLLMVLLWPIGIPTAIGYNKYKRWKWNREYADE